MRAAFKVIGDGKQVAVSFADHGAGVPAFETFKKRFAAFPAKIEMLSRFRTGRRTEKNPCGVWKPGKWTW